MANGRVHKNVKHLTCEIKEINFFHLLNLLLLLLSRPASTLRCCSSVLPPPWRLPPPLHLHAKGSLVLLEVLRVGADNLNLASMASTSDRREEISLESSNNCPSEQLFPSLSSWSCLCPCPGCVVHSDQPAHVHTYPETEKTV